MKIFDVIVQKIETNALYFVSGIKKEAKGTKEAVGIIGKYVKDGKISPEEDKILKAQMWDTLKVVGVVVPFIVIPGASILIPILIKVAKRNNIELLPASFNQTSKIKDGIQINGSAPTQCEMQGREEA